MKKTIISLVIIALGIGGFFLFSKKSSDNGKTDSYEKTNNEAMITDDDSIVDDGKMMDSDMIDSTSTMKGGSGMMDGNMMKGKNTFTITYTKNGYTPSSLEITKGDTVTFVNENGRDMWPASAMHPTHILYPGSDIKKCGTVDKDKIFDACEGVKNGQTWSFTFDHAGAWKFHDHLTPSYFGTITVK